MFDSDVSRDDRSKRLTRRVFVIGGATAAVGTVLVSRLFPGVEASTARHGTPGQVMLVNFSNDGQNLGEVTVPKMVKTDGEWYHQLGRNSFDIARNADTEMPYTGASWNEHGRGLFRCVACDTALFNSATKFDSGTGWPSFWQPVAKQNIVAVEDRSLGMARTEVKCARCESHLGHVFNDGPDPTGLRYCMNSGAMRFVKA